LGVHLSYPKFKVLDSNGDPVVGGKLYTYIVGTTTNKATYSDYNYVTQNTNPIVLDSAGEATIYLLGATKLVLKDSNDVEIWTMNNVTGIDYLGNVFYPYHGATDQGATGNSDTIKYAVDTAIGSDTGTIKLLHNSGSATTTYTLTNSETIPANITLEIEAGSLLDGAGTLTVYSPANLIVGKRQDWLGSSITLAFTNPAGGPVYPNWWIDNATPGTTDMTTAINAALTACENVFLLNEDYKTTASINMPTGCSLVGTGYHSEIISAYGGSVITTSDKENNTSFLRIENIGITGSDTASSVGIDFKAVTTSLIKNVYITNMETGIYLEGDSNFSTASSYNRIEFARITSGATGIKLLTTGTGERANGNRIVYPLIDTMTGNGIDATQIDSLIVEGGTIENITGNAIDLNDVINSKINSVYFDLLSTFAIHLDSDCEDNSIMNPTIPGGLKRMSDSGTDTVIVDDEYNKLVALSTEIGSNLITNGDFDSVTTGWTTDGTIVGSGQSGNCLSLALGETAVQSVSVITGRFYRWIVWIKDGTQASGTVRIYYGPVTDTAYKSTTTTTSWVMKTILFKAETSNGDFVLKNQAGGGTLLFDTVSLTEVPLANTGEIIKAAGTTGGYYLGVAETTVDITAAASCDILTQIPSGAKLLGAALRVESALAAGETWSAAYNGGATQSIATAGQAVAKDTRIETMFDANAATAITSATTNIRITADAPNFTAQGTIRGIIYYEEFVPMDTT